MNLKSALKIVETAIKLEKLGHEITEIDVEAGTAYCIKCDTNFTSDVLPFKCVPRKYIFDGNEIQFIWHSDTKQLEIGTQDAMEELWNVDETANFQRWLNSVMENKND